MDRSAPSISLEPRPANALRIALACVALLALVSLGMTRMPAWSLAVAAAFVVAQAGLADRALRRMASLRLALQRDGSWRSSAGDPADAWRLRDHALVGPLVALSFDRAGARPQRLLLLPGMIGPDELRALRVWLRYGYADDPAER
ncbi:MAG TPA: protein YgfX [Candidatus Saccharimonadia bacterium]|nr:protein YgfX [Candidatus Saccharimonadia bacterium]